MTQKIYAVLMILMGLVVLPHTAAIAQDLPTDYSSQSAYTIRYDDLDFLLSASVLELGLSDRRPAGRGKLRVTGTKLRHGNFQATAYEGNRVAFFEFGDSHLEHILAIRQDLEAVSEVIDFERLSKNEQLAYWLNLHNVAVIYEVTRAYPIKHVKPLMRGKNNVWGNKTMRVAGLPVSIRDIEDHVVANWNDPLVLYGLFMGTIGSPSLPAEAFQPRRIHQQLKDNAVEFVNSLRGFRVWSGRGRVSDHYALGRHYFPDFHKDIKSHLARYAEPETASVLEDIKYFRINNYNWGIADVKNGDTYNGSSFNTSPAALTWFVQSAPQGVVTGNISDSYVGDPAFNKAIISKIAPQTMALIRAVKERRARRVREGVVTIEEYINEDSGRIIEKNKTDGA